MFLFLSPPPDGPLNFFFIQFQKEEANKGVLGDRSGDKTYTKWCKAKPKNLFITLSNQNMNQ